MSFLPQNKELIKVISAVSNVDATLTLTATKIHNKVAQIFEIPEKLLLLEDENYFGSKYSYLMQWTRTGLMQKYKIISPKRRKWRLV